MSEAEDDRDSPLSPRYAVRTLALQPVKWRHFFHAVLPNALNSHSIEIECRLRSAWGDKIEVAGEQLSRLSISLQIARADQHWLDKTLADQGITLDDKGFSTKRPWLGKLNYYKPTSSGDGVVDEKTGSVTGWIAYGPENYDQILSALLAGKPNFLLSIGVRFDERGGTPEFPEYRWSGVKPVEILDGNLVFFSNNPEPEEDVALPDEPGPVDPHHALLESKANILAAVERLYMPLWVIVAGILIAIVIQVR